MALDRTSTGILVSRILGIFVLVYAMGYFPVLAGMSMTWAMAPSPVDHIVSLSYILFGFLLLVAGSYFLLVHARQAGQFLMSETNGPESRGGAGTDAVTTAAFLVIGVYLLCHAIPEASQLALERALGAPVGPRVIANYGSTAVKAGLGIWLLLGTRGIRRTIERIRS